MKDLISQEQQELKQMFNTAILEEVSQRLILFLSEQEPDDFCDTKKFQGGKAPEEMEVVPPPGDHEEGKEIDSETQQVDKMLEQSRSLVLQFFTKLIQDSTFPTNVRVFFVKN